MVSKGSRISREGKVSSRDFESVEEVDVDEKGEEEWVYIIKKEIFLIKKKKKKLTEKKQELS